PVVARIRDKALRPEYARRLAGWLGMEPEAVVRAVTDAARASGGQGAPSMARPPGPGLETSVDRPNPRDPVVKSEALSLGVLLQAAAESRTHPAAMDIYDQLTQAGVAGARFTVPVYRAIFDAITAAGGPGAASGDWVEQVVQEAGEMLTTAITE